MSAQEYGLVLPFDDQSESFVHGFEAGVIYTRMQRGDLVIDGPVHPENQALIERMAQNEGYDVRFEEYVEVEGWLMFSARLLNMREGAARNRQ